MSKQSMMQFAEKMLRESAFLRKQCDALEEYSDPDQPLPISLLGYFGTEIAHHYDAIDPEERKHLVAMIEQGVASSDNDVGTAVTTGLIEGLIHRAETIDGLWPRIEASLGPHARAYANAYRNADYTVSPS